MAIRSRPYASDRDLRSMQALASELWSLEPFAEWHAGDLAWRRCQHVGREAEWRIRLWEEGGRVVAWAWLALPGSLEAQLHPRLRGGPAHDELLEWAASAAEGDELETTALANDSATIAVLRRHGYRDAPPRLAHLVRALDGPVPRPPLPDGFVLRHVRDDDDLEARVDVHRAAFAPSRVTTESYRNVMSAWPYRPELDCVVEAPDGSFASYCLCWLDQASRSVELEPVGTRPAYDRRGLARAVCSFGLDRARELGAATAVVYARADDAYPRPKRLYESLGFAVSTRWLAFRRTS